MSNKPTILMFHVDNVSVGDFGCLGALLPFLTVYNLTFNPDEDTPYNYKLAHSWVLYKVFGPKTMELKAYLKKDSVPFGTPLEFNPYNT